MWYFFRKKFLPWLLTNHKTPTTNTMQWAKVPGGQLRTCGECVISKSLLPGCIWQDVNLQINQTMKYQGAFSLPPPTSSLFLLLPQLSHGNSLRNACLEGYHYNCGMCPPRDFMILVVWAPYLIQVMLPFWESLQGDNPLQRGQVFRAIRDLYI